MTESGRVMDPFDPAKASAPTRVVPVRRVVDLLEVTNAPETVARYRDAMARGERFPPVAVIPFVGRYFIADGHKRFTAALPLAGDEVAVEVWGWGRLAADLWRQSRAQQRLFFEIFSRREGLPPARERAAAFFGDNWRHLRRMARSLWAVLRG